ncbi:MAG: hypothetical protein IPK26_13225 [Planctomycetes bacterium]|nr:hypothetical protein [Planctomycetota bacterium]
MRAILTAASVPVLLTVVLSAQPPPQWFEITPPISPSPRADFGMVYDRLRATTVLLGGTGGNDTWLLQDGHWQEVQPAHAPPGGGAGLTYDSGRGRAVLFGAGTWEWDGSDWLLQTPAHVPPARDGYAMAFDAARARCVLFGGQRGVSTFLADTWEWDGSDWVERLPPTAPTPRMSHAMAFDAARARVMMFGGRGDTGFVEASPWEWDGLTWTPRPSSGGPDSRYGHRMAFDAARRVIVMHGGYQRSSADDPTWEWNGAFWAQIHTDTAPPARARHGLVFDEVAERTLAFGGFIGAGPLRQDLWSYRGSPSPASQATFGSPCWPTHLATTEPWLGEPLTATLSVPAPTSQPCVFVLGFSDTRYWFLELPAEMSSFGMPDCVLYTDVQASWLVMSSGGTASWSMNVPAAAPLRGMRLFQQAFAHRPDSNSRQWLLSNAVALWIGARTP